MNEQKINGEIYGLMRTYERVMLEKNGPAPEGQSLMSMLTVTPTIRPDGTALVTVDVMLVIVQPGNMPVIRRLVTTSGPRDSARKALAAVVPALTQEIERERALRREAERAQRT